jgi:hypothetical protein
MTEKQVHSMLNNRKAFSTTIPSSKRDSADHNGRTI